MLSDAEIDALFAQAKTPYSQGEIQTFILNPDSRARETLEHVHYHNYALCNSIIDWQNYLKCIGSRPPTSLHLLLTPGYGGANDARKSLEYLADFFSGFNHGSLPRWPILGWMSRSAFTLVDTVASLHNTEHLIAARRHLGEFVDLLLYKGEPLMRRDELAERLHSAQANFLDACERNAVNLSQWIDSPKKEEKTFPTHRQRTSYTISIENAATLVGTSPKTFQRRLNENPDLVRLMREPVIKVCMAAVKDWWTAYEKNIAVARREVRAMNRPLHLE